MAHLGERVTSPNAAPDCRPSSSRDACAAGRSGRGALLDLAAGLLDRRARALGRAHRGALQRDGAADLARQDHLRALGLQRHDARGDQRREVDEVRLHLREVGQRRLRRGSLASRSGSRPSAGGAATASGRLRSRPCDSRPCARAGPCRPGRRSCPGRRTRRDRRAGAGACCPRGFHCVQSHLCSFSPTRARRSPGASRPRSCRAPRGVSSTTRESRIRRSPRPRTEARMLCSCPCTLRFNVTLSFCLAHGISPVISSSDLPRFAAMWSGDGHARERVEGRAHHVDRVARAVALGEHVAHAGAFEHRAHAAAGDHAGAVRCRLHVDARRAVPALHRVVQRVVAQAARSSCSCAPAASPWRSRPALRAPCRSQSRPPAPSPTTVSAVKPNWRPPLTTLATRLTATSFSISSSPDCGFFDSCHYAVPWNQNLRPFSRAASASALTRP